MSGLLGTFLLKDFDDFFDNYKLENALADEALMALEHFLPALNVFFDLCENLTDANKLKLKLKIMRLLTLLLYNGMIFVIRIIQDDYTNIIAHYCKLQTCITLCL